MPRTGYKSITITKQAYNKLSELAKKDKRTKIQYIEHLLECEEA